MYCRCARRDFDRFLYSSLITWRTDWILKLYEKTALSESAAVECCKKRYARRCIFIASYNSYEPAVQTTGKCVFYQERKIKPLQLKKDIILWLPHCSEALLYDGKLLSSHLPKHWKPIPALETVVSHRLSTARSWVMNWSMKDAPLPLPILRGNELIWERCPRRVCEISPFIAGLWSHRDSIRWKWLFVL